MNKKERADQLRQRTKALAEDRARMLQIEDELRGLRDRLELEWKNWSDDLFRQRDEIDGQQGNGS